MKSSRGAAAEGPPAQLEVVLVALPQEVQLEVLLVLLLEVQLVAIREDTIGNLQRDLQVQVPFKPKSLTLEPK